MTKPWAKCYHLAPTKAMYVETEGTAIDGKLIVADVKLMQTNFRRFVDDSDRFITVVTQLWQMLLSRRSGNLGCEQIHKM